MVPPRKDGRHASDPYRVRAAGTWYWVDPTVPREGIEPGDAVVVYPVGGDAVVAVMLVPHGAGHLAFATTEGERFEVAPDDIAAIHLATVDDVQ